MRGRGALPGATAHPQLTVRTLEHFCFWGIVDKLRAARAMPNNYPIAGVTAYKHLMSEHWYVPPGRETVRSFY